MEATITGIANELFFAIKLLFSSFSVHSQVRNITNDSDQLAMTYNVYTTFRVSYIRTMLGCRICARILASL